MDVSRGGSRGTCPGERVGGGVAWCGGMRLVVAERGSKAPGSKYLPRRARFQRLFIPNYSNLVKLNFDLYAENWSYVLSSTPIHVVFVDALHDYAGATFDIRAVL